MTFFNNGCFDNQVVLVPGPRGAQGPMGPQGPAGTSETHNNAHIISTADQNVCAGAAIPLFENALIEGDSIKHVPGSPQIYLKPGTYMVKFFAVETVPCNSHVATVAFAINNAIQEENVFTLSAHPGSTVQIDGNQIFKINYESFITLFNNGTSRTFNNVVVDIIKLA